MDVSPRKNERLREQLPKPTDDTKGRNVATGVWRSKMFLDETLGKMKRIVSAVELFVLPLEKVSRARRSRRMMF